MPDSNQLTPLVIGNWKMNGTRAFVRQIAAELKELNHLDIEVAVLPPALFIGTAVAELQNSQIQVGGQNIHPEVSGAYTGEISAEMLAACGCTLALAGHSERRTYQHESDAEVAVKCAAIIRTKMMPVLCLGENLKQYQEQQTEPVITRQLHALLTAPEQIDLTKLTIAYEPVWAIGTKQAADPGYANNVHKLIRSWLKTQLGGLANKIRILYGGSVNESNAQHFVAQSEINGLLVGNASLNAAQFRKILYAVSGRPEQE